MEEKKLPWWRRALSVALDGLRSGFGLFSRSHKEDTDPGPETASGRQEDPQEDIDLTEHSPVLKQVEDVAPDEAAEIAARVEPSMDVRQAEIEVRHVAESADTETQEQACDVEKTDETVAEAERPAVEEDAPVEEEEPAVVEELPGVAVEAPVTHEDVAAAVVAGEEPALVVEDEESAAVTAASAGPEVDEPIVELPREELSASNGELAEAAEIVEQTLLDVVLTGEQIFETEVEQKLSAKVKAKDEPVTESAEKAESAAPIVGSDSEPQTEPELEPEAEIADAVGTDVDEDISEDVAPDLDDEPVQGVVATETIEEPEAEAEAEAEMAAEAEAEVDAGPDAEVVTEGVEEPAGEEADEEELTANVDPVPEVSASPVELSEPATDEGAELTGENDAAGEDQEWHETVPEHETVEEQMYETAEEAEPETEEATEPASEIEDPSETMELNEPISDLIADAATEPTAASEVAPDVETMPTVEEATAEDAPGVEADENNATADFVNEDEAATAEVALVEPVGTPVGSLAVADASERESDDEPTLTEEPAAQVPHKPFIKLESRDNEADLSPFSVIVSQVYDGPLDLLLDLIRKQDIDIYDIPIARITAQFLAYVNQLKASDVDVAGEFIYTASLLIHIKSKMLLPRAPSGPEDAAEDPRRELVERLLEHERFKNAAQMLQQKQMLEAATWTNPGIREFKDDEGLEPEIAADTVDLVRVFRDILERARNRPIINVEEDSVTVGQMIQFLSRRLTMEDKPIALHKLLSQTQSERALIAMFLALLELVRLQAILLRQDRAFSEIFIKKNTGFEAVMNEGLANARDDWQ